jgi:hypothetical protein
MHKVCHAEHLKTEKTEIPAGVRLLLPSCDVKLSKTFEQIHCKFSIRTTLYAQGLSCWKHLKTEKPPNSYGMTRL